MYRDRDITATVPHLDSFAQAGYVTQYKPDGRACPSAAVTVCPVTTTIGADFPPRGTNDGHGLPLTPVENQMSASGVRHARGFSAVSCAEISSKHRPNTVKAWH